MYKIAIRKRKRRRCEKLEMFRDPLHFKGTIVEKDVVILPHKRSLSTGISVSRKSNLSAMRSNVKYNTVVELTKTN